MLADGAIENVLLRFAVLLGTALSAGSILFAVTNRQVAAAVKPTLRRQILIGVCLVIVAEPLRWFADQLAMSGGDIALALDPAMRWIAFEMPQGQAALVRVLGIGTLATFWSRWPVLAIAGLTLALGSFAIEGHTAAMASRMPWLSGFLFLHLLALSWWFAGLWPLAVSLQTMSDEEARRAVERFGSIAVGAFALLTIAGAIMFLTLTGGTLDLASPYQRIVLAKLFVVAAILALAGYNKFVLTPKLETSPQSAKQTLRASIRFEIGLAAIVLLLTAFLSTMSPGAEH